MKPRSAKMLLAAVALTVAVSACTAQHAAGPSPSPTINWTTKLAAFTAKYGENPASDPPFTEAQAKAVTAHYSDRQWAILLKQYPEAVRPTDSFIHWTSNDDPDRAACLTAAGSTPDTGVTADRTTAQGGSGPATIENAVATFDCEWVRYPVRESPWPNKAQLSYYYDYLTQYLVPCYQVHGAKIDLGMPNRAKFIAQNQSDFTGVGWHLTPPDAADAPDPTYDGKTADCSATGPGDAQP